LGLPLHERAGDGLSEALVRVTEHGLVFGTATVDGADFTFPKLIPQRPLEEGEQYRFHFDMTKCIGCRSCEVACNEQNGNPADILWRRIGELEAGMYPETQRHYLSMGCNHCLDADCLKGCPVDAYKKDERTGIVMHSADACIGCSYCVWNCPYSVPQYNPERGVVGKCDMCKGRLDEGQEPACVNACPEGAIEIEIVNMEAWCADYAGADSPGMPAAGQTVSTTRITLPEATTATLERVDSGQIHAEHAHWSLVVMTTLMQMVAGALCVLLLLRGLTAVRMMVLLTLTAVAITGSTLHLGRPAYAWRALKMWRRSWLSREVLVFTLFLLTLSAATACAAAGLLHVVVDARLVAGLEIAAAVLGVVGTCASAAIYLVKARPAWNAWHTPVDFLLTAGMLGAVLAEAFAASGVGTRVTAVMFAGAWVANQIARGLRLRGSAVFEARASYELMRSAEMRVQTVASLALVMCAAVLAGFGSGVPALVCGVVGVVAARWLFFVSVVPLNMALTFVRGGAA
jgi:DMSO reductase iron-sulfur subunit